MSNINVSNDLFTKSIKPKQTFNIHMHLDIFAKRKFESEGFRKKVEKIKSNIDFLNEDVKKSEKLEDNFFTNYLSKSTPTNIKERIRDLFDDPSIINNVRAGNVNINERVIKCVGLYHTLDEDEPVIFKSQLSDPFNEQTGVRVYAIVNTVEVGKKAEFRIVLIDPFHLVLPSDHKGKQKDIVQRENYELNKNNTVCMNDYYKSLFE